jgi:hypothetical protein
VTDDVTAVLGVLERYQELYRARDVLRLDEAMALFVSDDEPEMIGTEAVSRGDPDWAVGHAAVRALTEWDWRSWDDVEFDLPSARVTVEGDTAWASMPVGLVPRAPEERRRPMTFTVLLVRRTGRWLLHTTHWSIAAE